ncbi:Predicted arabinose efflux permease, MFS family [Streptomyces sp. yr375]|uniref:MFS transporter n=1 Tax=Streptomyces sp. yr375 TaxID=1761906 RepID=UPI0008BF7CA8|nr:MFS transporter [Streptomyces sp. yr375]SER31724.1 Predicted arabinose efflux permease, MFS family [Streptomyces sp. yr375]
MSASHADGVRPSYAVVLRVPHARRTFAAALVGRLSYGIVPLSLMLAVTRSSGSYPVAGTVMALFGATVVFLSPARAALIDRYGPRRALVPMAAACTTVLGLLAAAVSRPDAVSALSLGALAAVAGACAPPLGPTMRAVWGRLTPDRALLRRAYSLDGVAEELLFVTGPLLVGVLVGFAPPAAGIVVGAALMAGGTAGFVSSPAVRDVRPEKAAGRRGGGGLRGLGRPVVAIAGVGLALGVIDLLVVAFAERHTAGTGAGGAGAAWVLAALSAGSAVGGLLNGAVAWRTPAGARLPLLTAGLGLTLCGAGLAPGLGTLAVAVAAAGFFVSPAITTAYLIADETAAPEARVRAGAWVNTAVNAGSTAGTAVAGALAARLPVGVCFAVTGAVVLATATAVTAMRRRGTSEPVPLA